MLIKLEITTQEFIVVNFISMTIIGITITMGLISTHNIKVYVCKNFKNVFSIIFILEFLKGFATFSIINEIILFFTSSVVGIVICSYNKSGLKSKITAYFKILKVIIKVDIFIIMFNYYLNAFINSNIDLLLIYHTFILTFIYTFLFSIYVYMEMVVIDYMSIFQMIRNYKGKREAVRRTMYIILRCRISINKIYKVNVPNIYFADNLKEKLQLILEK